ncbi:MAG: hypothetical protein HY360_07980 [Verrucomicrobia bacterium]|nr:hypothetical protein [Verrucomicrobiota bacterium]
MSDPLLSKRITPNAEGLIRCIRRKGTPARVHFIELSLDAEIQQAIFARYDLISDLDGQDPFIDCKCQLRLQRFLGYDYVRCMLKGMAWPLHRETVHDTAALRRETGRSYLDQHKGPITNRDEFESYPWPDPSKADTRMLEWYEANLPEDMCVIVCGVGPLAEYLSALMGYETLCYALRDQRDLVKAVSDRLIQIFSGLLRRVLTFKRVRIVWPTDDMGFRTGTLISPDDLREFVLPGHKRLCQMTHDDGRLYLLHSDGKLDAIMPDLIDKVRIDGKHSFEDTIERVTDAKKKYGDKIALLGGIDVDFLCRADESQIRRRVRETLDACLPGGGFCLGTGNTVANYIPLDNYLVMLDEGRRYVSP